jgi:hypothetical protein
MKALLVLSPKINVSNAICYRVLVQRSRSRPASGTTAALRRTSSTLVHSNKSHRYINFLRVDGVVNVTQCLNITL